MLVVENLSKTYSGGVRALDGITIEIPYGMFGLLGPNGAGKTTFMRIIATLLDPDTGKISWKDIDVLKEPHKFKKVLGYLPQDFGVYKNIPAYQMLYHFAVLKGYSPGKETRKLVDYWLDRVNLYNDRKRKLGEYSGGMRQRFGIAVSLIGNPEILIVDEPTAGLDPAERRRFLNLLSELGENRTVILSTHIVDDVEELCDNMAIIKSGRILVKGKTDDIVSALRGKVFTREVSKHEVESIKEKYRVLNLHLKGGKIHISIYSEELPGDEWRVQEPTLEEAYFYHVGYHTI